MKRLMFSAKRGPNIETPLLLPERAACLLRAAIVLTCGALIFPPGSASNNALADAVPPAQSAVTLAAAGAASLGQRYDADSEKCARDLLPAPQYPLKVSSNKRYLVDQNDVPFLMMGDAPQTIVANLSLSDADKYMSNRKNYGINTLWINILCNFSDGCKPTAETYDGVPPFTTKHDLASPNPEYFARADEIMRIAARHGMTVLLNPIETGSWLGTLRANGDAKAFAYGQWLGRRFREFSNIIWMHGNDFQSWNNALDARLVQAVARGIRSTDPNHIHTVELNYHTSGSLDDPSWAPLVELDAAYTYFPTYAEVLKEYNRPDFRPVFMVEGNYELEHLRNVDGGSVKNLRRQEYWTMLSGATGQLYGSYYTWRLPKGWDTNLDTLGIRQFCYMRELFISLPWYELVPDQKHQVVVDGYGSFSGLVGTYLVAFEHHAFEHYPTLVRRVLSRLRSVLGVGAISSNNYVSAARALDGSLVLAYVPASGAVTVDMSKLTKPATARWYDPTNGRYVPVAGSPFPNSTTRTFATPGKNREGDGDWVLVLETSAAH